MDDMIPGNTELGRLLQEDLDRCFDRGDNLRRFREVNTGKGKAIEPVESSSESVASRKTNPANTR